jgi:hypothetical protein
MAGDANPVWIPAPQLNRTDADVSLFFLAPNSIEYDSPVDDPWFSAHRETNVTRNGVFYEWFFTDYFIHVLGCVDQYQFCNPTTENCTPLSGLNAANETMQYLQFNNYQFQTAYLIGNAALCWNYSTIGPTSL